MGKTQETVAEVVVNQQDMETLIRSDPAARLKVENIALLRTLGEKNAENAKLEKEIEAARTKADVVSLNHTLSEHRDTDVEELAAENDGLHTEIHNLKKDVEESETIITSLKLIIEANKSLLMEKLKLEKRLEQADRADQVLRGMVAFRDKEIEALEAALTEFQTRYPNENVETYDGVKALGNGPDQ